jgi:hypothetical protein
MRLLCSAALVAGLCLASAGCGPRKSFDGPTVDAFNGRVTHDGKPVSFPDGEQASLTLFHEKAQSFVIRLKPDGSFQIGWMPIGRYSAVLERARPDQRGPASRYNVPGVLTIEAGKTEYNIELGKGWKP